MNELTIWDYDSVEIRTIEIDGEAWFVGRDICSAFRDSNSSRSLSRIDETDKRMMEITDRRGRKQNAIFVNESGMYALLFTMQPQKAHNDGLSDEYPIEIQKRIDRLHDFKHWVTHEVLPNIRKNGSYGIPGNISPTLRVLIEHEKKMNEISAKVEETEQKVERIRTRYTSSHLDWRKEAAETIAAIAVKLHSNPNVTGEIWAEAYRLLEKRANCKLAVRLCNLRNRVLWEKPVYEQMPDIYELDVIANDKRLKEIFINIIREMAIRYDA